MADNLLVNRDGQTYQVDMENTKSIQDTDLLLVNRNGTTYTVAGSEISRGDFTEVVITPTSIVPEPSEQLLTAVTDIPKVGSDVPADVFWTWYQYDEATGTAGQKILKTLTNRESSDTLVLPAASANKYIGCSVEYLAVTINETERCAVGQPSGPVAVMSGLRFDGSRATTLSRRFTSESKTYTFSAWFKRLENSNSFFLFSTTHNADGEGCRLSVLADGKIKLTYGAGTNNAKDITSTSTIDLNTWSHIVVSIEDTSKTGKISINGSTEAFSIPQSFPIETFVPFSINKYRTGFEGYADGYLSDVYFIDGYALPPTVFGQQFAEGWGPLDKTQVATKIGQSGPEQPYDSRANTDQVWSDMLTGASTITLPTAAFDGDLTVKAQSNGGLTFTTSIPIKQSVEVYSNNSVIKFNVNGPSWSDPTADGWTQGNAGWNTIYTGSGTLNTLNAVRTDNVANTAGWYAVRVDGRLLVDNGVWDNSQNWSDSVTGVDGSAAPAFDGSGSEVASQTSGGTITFSPNFGSGSFNVEVVVNDIDASPNNTVRIDGTPLTAGAAGSNRVFSGTVSSFNTMTVDNSSGKSNFRSVSVNGAILVDAGVLLAGLGLG